MATDDAPIQESITIWDLTVTNKKRQLRNLSEDWLAVWIGGFLIAVFIALSSVNISF